MPDRTFQTTAAGWPYMDTENYVDATPAWSVELVTKLQNGEAAVPRAENAATRAENAAAAIPKMASGRVPSLSAANNNSSALQTVTFPAGRFSSAPSVFLQPATGSSSDYRRHLSATIYTVTATQLKFYLHNTHATYQASGVAVHWLAIG